jgi:hypothetical protein
MVQFFFNYVWYILFRISKNALEVFQLFHYIHLKFANLVGLV